MGDNVISIARYQASQQSIAELTRKLDKQENIINILEAEKRQWVEQKSMQDIIIQQQLTNSDSVVSHLQNEIRTIKDKYNIKD